MSRDLDLQSFADFNYSSESTETYTESEPEAVDREPQASRTRPSLLPRPSLAPRPARRRPTSRQRRNDSNGRRARQVEARPVEARPAVERRPGCPDALLTQQLLAEYTPVVRQIVGGFQRKLPRNILREDLIGAGMSGLWDAIRRQGDKRGESFEWYVRVRIRGAILDELRAQDWLPRRARSGGDDAKASVPSVVRFDEISDWEHSRCLAMGDESNSEAAVHAKFTREALAQAIEQLPERERHIVAAHYFLGVKFKDLGAELGVSEPRISQLHSRAMQRLKTIMVAQGA
jgi:RNA polymerase sigma factor for flagellar operon FliA